MAYRENRDRGSRNYRQRPAFRSSDGNGNHNHHNRVSTVEATTPAPVVLLKRRPVAATETTPVPLPVPTPATSASSSAAPSPKGNEKKAPLILQRPPRVTDGDNPNSSVTPLPEINSHGEKAKEKVQPPNLADLLKPFTCMQEFATPLLDNSLKVVPESNFDFLVNRKKSTDFLVVSAIGPPRSGKSALLSYLAENSSIENGKVFQARKRTEQKQCSIYAASNNIIYIEMASVFNGSAAADLISTLAQYGNLEAAVTAWNLRLMRWALSISHVILLVSDSLFDANLLQLINSAEMISPMESAFGDGSYPELLLVSNKAPVHCTSNSTLQSQVEGIFQNVTGRSPRVNRNVFLLPHKKFTADNDRFTELRTTISNLNTYFRAPFADDRVQMPQKITLHEWYSSLNRLWEDMNQQNYFTNYVKLLP